MKPSLPLPTEKKLTVIFRVEPGSLGPNGPTQAQAFCLQAESQFSLMDADFIHWQIIPRFDKSLAELEYAVGNKRLSREQAQQYLKVFGQDLHEVEDHLISEISRLIGLHQTR